MVHNSETVELDENICNDIFAGSSLMGREEIFRSKSILNHFFEPEKVSNPA
jgi:hypothetical protein